MNTSATCCCAKEDPDCCNCVPKLSVGFALRAYIAVILVQIVITIIIAVLTKCMGIDLRETFASRAPWTTA